MRNSFQNIYDRTVMVADPPETQRKRRKLIHTDESSVTQHYRRLHAEIFDNIVVQINTRFENIGKLKFLELLDSSKFLKYEQEFPISAFKSLQENYGGYFDTASLRSELNVIFKKSTFKNRANIRDIFRYIISNELQEVLPETVKLCNMILTISVTTAGVARSFSTLKRLTHLKVGQGGKDSSSQRPPTRGVRICEINKKAIS